MSGEKNLTVMIKNMDPYLNQGNYVFVSVKSLEKIKREDTICEFKEEEGVTVVMRKSKADELELDYDFIASWITLKLHSSLDAVGLTAFFSNVLAENNISCNVVAGYYHDHIFVHEKDAEKAIKLLRNKTEAS